MGGIKVWILRRDFRLVKKKLDSSASHLHYKNGSYLNIEQAILNKSVVDEKIDELKPDPILIFQEGNAFPKSAGEVYNNIEWELWRLPKERGMHGRTHGRGIGFGRIFNMKTMPLIIIALAVLAYFINIYLNPAPLPTENLPLHTMPLIQ